MNPVSIQAFAKVNLFLDVLGKRADGTHELLTLFERVGLSDELIVRQVPGSGIALETSDPNLPVDGTNLVVRAAEEFRLRSGWKEGIALRLEKRIPVGGGLGGGSSDAAATLIALQTLSRRVLAEADLLACARSLGADVAFFAARTPWGLGRARGDEIEPKKFPVKLWHLLVTPDFPIPTSSVYSALVVPGRHPDIVPMLSALSDGRSSEVPAFLYNALEPAAEKLYPRIREVKTEMEAVGLEGPMLSGSGSTVFALCDSEAQAYRAGDALKSAHPTWKINVVSTV